MWTVNITITVQYFLYMDGVMKERKMRSLGEGDKLEINGNVEGYNMPVW